MKLSYEWLKDFVDIGMKPERLAQALTMAGLEVESMESLRNDAHYELGVTPNRSDCLSVIGVAREVAAITGRNLKNLKIKAPAGKGKIAEFLKVTVQSNVRCPRYAARVIRGVKIGPSPAWVVKRLSAAGVRAINNVVDATNYVMIERGQPLHAFDARMIEGNRIVVRRADDTKKFRTLDGVDRALEKEDLLICDASKPVALAGVMGGENSEVRDDTADLVLESAYFEPMGIRRTSKRLGLSSESSQRFERGVDPNGIVDALNRLTEIIAGTAGGVPTSDWVDVYPKKCVPTRINFDPREIQRICGIAIPATVIKKILAGLGFGVSLRGGKLSVVVPTYRPDIKRPVDIVEEVVRIYGYDRVPSTMPKFDMARRVEPRFSSHVEETRALLTSIGFSEAQLMAFESAEALEYFRGEDDVSPPVIVNPLSQQETVMRTQLCTGLLNAVRLNVSRQQKDVKLFSLQRAYRRPVGKVRSPEPLRLAGIMTGRRDPFSWRENARQVDFYDAKGTVEAVLKRLGLSEQTLFQRGGTYGFLVPGSYAVVLCANKRVGWVGELHPHVTEKWEIAESVFVFELDFEAIASLSKVVVSRFRELGRFPFVERDLSIIVDSSIPHVEIERTISKSVSTLLTDVKLFDVYRGKGIPEGRKSVAYHIRYSSDLRTLTDDEVNSAHTKVIEAVTSDLGAVLR